MQHQTKKAIQEVAHLPSAKHSFMLKSKQWNVGSNGYCDVEELEVREEMLSSNVHEMDEVSMGGEEEEREAGRIK